jgi:hypothetical protein
MIFVGIELDSRRLCFECVEIKILLGWVALESKSQQTHHLTWPYLTIMDCYLVLMHYRYGPGVLSNYSRSTGNGRVANPDIDVSEKTCGWSLKTRNKNKFAFNVSWHQLFFFSQNSYYIVLNCKILGRVFNKNF